MTTGADPGLWYVAVEKLTGYLLSSSTEKSRSRLRFLSSFGFDPNSPHILRDSILTHRLERSSLKWLPVQRKRARQNKGLEPYPIARRSGTALNGTSIARPPSQYGEHCNVRGPLKSPDGRDPVVTTCWTKRTGENLWRFTTLLPR